jgi:hypothetical protein
MQLGRMLLAMRDEYAPAPGRPATAPADQSDK